MCTSDRFHAFTKIQLKKKLTQPGHLMHLKHFKSTLLYIYILYYYKFKLKLIFRETFSNYRGYKRQK